MSIGKWLTDLVMGQPALQPIPVRAASRAQLIAEASRQVRNVSPETRQRLADALEAQAARQRIDRQLRDSGGAQNATDVMRNMMSRR
ncbi:MAG: hypothetical protein HYU58_09230 [Proteobacteria bacterium]|nr:hypothetical protein [Pseudomonadota bacterium]